MGDIIIALIILVVSFLLIIKSISPYIDIVVIGKRKYKILLWYNSFKGNTVKRKWIKLYESKKL